MNFQTFIDTSHIIALVDTNDEFHAVAELAVATRSGKMITTDAVLIEIGNALSKPNWRQLAIEMIKAIRNDPDIEILPIDISLFDRAFQFYSSRPDKEWSLTDCISFVVMQERGIIEALTIDHHFQQAGFRAILRELKN